MKTNSARICGLGKELRAELARAATAPQTTVLVWLERGMPWPSLMRVLHELAPNSAAAFQVLHCSANSGALLRESLLAIGSGTLFLHDVALLAAEDQAWLACALGSRRCAGAPIEARICATVFADPDGLVESGALRADLLYRLNGLFVRPEPLRERGHAIEGLALELARHFFLLEDESGPAPRLTPAALAALRSYDWPGNERELELVIERAVLLAGDALIDAEHLGLGGGAREPRGDVLPLGDRSLRSVEEALIRRVLDEQGGNKSRAATVLGLHRATLHEKLASFDLAS